MSKPGKLDRSQLTLWSRFWLLWWQSPSHSVLLWILLMLIWPLLLAACSLPVTSSSPSSPASAPGYLLKCRPTVGLTFLPSTYLQPPHLTGLEGLAARAEIQQIGLGLRCRY